MTENQLEQNSFESSASREPTEEDIRRCVEAEILEMEKYKWILGVQLKHDPLQDRSLNEIYCEWIDKYAADFRKYWEIRKQNSAGAALQGVM
jgi:hypothetical protein